MIYILHYLSQQKKTADYRSLLSNLDINIPLKSNEFRMTFCHQGIGLSIPYQTGLRPAGG